MGENVEFCDQAKKPGRPKGSRNKPKPDDWERPPHGNAGMWRPGNHTKGANRRGYKGGRRKIYSPGTRVAHVALDLSDEELAVAVYAGEGKIPKGIRRALAALKARIPGVPQSRNAAERACESSRIAINRAMRELFEREFKIVLPALKGSGSERIHNRSGTMEAEMQELSRKEIEPLDFE